MKNLIIILVFALNSLFIYSQDVPVEYDFYIEKADSFFNIKDYKNASLNYSEAFKVNFWRGSLYSRYNAACAWALISKPDSAFYQLKRISSKAKNSYYDQFISDSSFCSLYTDSRWGNILEIEKQKKDIIEKNYNRPLIAKLDTIYYNDQKYRHQLDSIEKIDGIDSKEIDNHWKLIKKIDSINLIEIKLIIDKYGWLGPDIITYEGNSTLFLVIQHSNLETQLKYLPIMKEAVLKGNASGDDLALLEDRVLLGLGKKQVYGSQIGRDDKNIFYVQPLEDPDNVDKRRAEVGLGPLSEYISNWGIIWDVEKYKIDLPFLENKLKGK